MPSLVAYPAGRVPINSTKLENLSKLSNYVIGYDFYTVFQEWRRSEEEVRLQALNENGDDKTEKD